MDTNGSEVVEEEDLLKSPPNFLEAENHSVRKYFLHIESLNHSLRSHK